MFLEVTTYGEGAGGFLAAAVAARVATSCLFDNIYSPMVSLRRAVCLECRPIATSHSRTPGETTRFALHGASR
jgi:hypothetical protein